MFKNRTVGELVAEDYRRAGVFKKFGIDFCCGGGRTLEEACSKKQVDVADVEHALATANTTDGTAARMQPDGWPLDFLANYIETIHHTYAREAVPILLNFSQKVARVHGHSNPEVVQVAHLVHELGLELVEHFRAEEEVLFPYIKRLVAAENNTGAAAGDGLDNVAEPIAAMEDDHERAGELMAEIRRLTSDFMPPEHACNTYRALFAKLEEFEEDLHRHVHLENNVLFPKASALESALFSGRSASA